MTYRVMTAEQLLQTGDWWKPAEQLEEGLSRMESNGYRLVQVTQVGKAPETVYIFHKESVG